MSAAKRCGKSAWLTRPELLGVELGVPRVGQRRELFAADLLIGVLVALREELRDDRAALPAASAATSARRAAGPAARPPPAGSVADGRFW